MCGSMEAAKAKEEAVRSGAFEASTGTYSHTLAQTIAMIRPHQVTTACSAGPVRQAGRNHQLVFQVPSFVPTAYIARFQNLIVRPRGQSQPPPSQPHSVAMGW